jgi:hypothetical protein
MFFSYNFLLFWKCYAYLEVLHFPFTMDACDVNIFIVYLFLFGFYFILFMFLLCILGALCF